MDWTCEKIANSLLPHPIEVRLRSRKGWGREWKKKKRVEKSKTSFSSLPSTQVDWGRGKQTFATLLQMHRPFNCFSPVLRNFLCIGCHTTIQFFIERIITQIGSPSNITEIVRILPKYAHISTVFQWDFFFFFFASHVVANKWFLIQIYRNISWKWLMSLNDYSIWEYAWSAYFLPSTVPDVEKQKIFKIQSFPTSNSQISGGDWHTSDYSIMQQA